MHLACQVILQAGLLDYCRLSPQLVVLWENVHVLLNGFDLVCVDFRSITVFKCDMILVDLP